jgi:hypothetical protein
LLPPLFDPPEPPLLEPPEPFDPPLADEPSEPPLLEPPEPFDPPLADEPPEPEPPDPLEPPLPLPELDELQPMAKPNARADVRISRNKLLPYGA